MSFYEIVLFGIGLAMDAFAVSVCKGLCMKKINYRYASLIAVFFGFFQALMPFLGYWLGKSFESYITSVDHWVAFILLGYIGIKMIREAFEEEEMSCKLDFKIDIKELFILAIATSIDALAVGIAFSFNPRVNIYENIAVIGIVTFIISFFGVIIGNRFGARYHKKAETVGGIILVLLGLKILLEGVGLA